MADGGLLPVFNIDFRGASGGGSPPNNWGPGGEGAFQNEAGGLGAATPQQWGPGCEGAIKNAAGGSGGGSPQMKGRLWTLISNVAIS